MEHRKILPFDGCAATFEALRKQGETIVHCHGTFDLIHPGHVKHLAEAKRLGSKLVVTVTAAPFVNKGPGRPVFSDDQRAFQLSHLELVDYVVVVPATGAVEIVERVRPHFYCKGAEYATPKDETERRIEEDAAAVRRCGGEVRFIGEPLHSSSTLLFRHTDSLDREVREYLEANPFADTLKALDTYLAAIKKLRVLVVGDLIIDRYTYCTLQGLTTKAKVLSVRPSRDEDQIGGSFAPARQIASFGCRTRLVALTGTEPWLDPLLATVGGDLGGDLVRHPQYETIVKQRFVERLGIRTDLAKYFEVNRLIDQPPPPMRQALLQKLETALGDCDLVVLCDYGHGVVDEEVQRLLCERAPLLAVNCQTNSYNYGFNLLTKYKRCDIFSLDEPELALACGDRKRPFADRLQGLARQVKAKQAWLTLGSRGSIAWQGEGVFHTCPAMTKRIVDTVGAGDAFFATAALAAKVGMDLPLVSVISNLSGAMASSWPGNSDYVNAGVLIKNARYLLKAAGK